MADKAEQAQIQARLDELTNGDDWAKLSPFGKLKRLIRPQKDDRARLKSIIIKENLFDLLMGSLWAPLIRSKDLGLFSAGVALDTTKSRSRLSWGRLKYDLNDHIWVDVQRKLKAEISAMPLVEKEPIEEEVNEIPQEIAQRTVRLIETRLMKMVSATGIVGSGVVLVPLLAPLVGGTIAALGTISAIALAGAGVGVYFDKRLKRLSHRSQNHIINAWRNMLKYRRISNKASETLEATGTQQETDEKYKQAEQDSKEVDMAINEKRMQLGAKNVWASVGIILGSLAAVTTLGLLNGIPLLGLGLSVSSIYLASNTFLGSLQRWFSAGQTESDLKIQMKKKYEKIRHKKEYDLICGSKKLKGTENALRISNIRFSLRDEKHPEKRNSTPMIDSKETIVFGPGINVINGPSGCGKSTLYKLFKHWDDVDRGSIEYGTIKDGVFNGTPLTDLEAKPDLPVAFSFQQLHGCRDMTIDEFWRLGKKNLNSETIKKWAEMFGLEAWTDEEKTRYKQIRNLSGGELKRVALALALLQTKKRIVVLDECTSGLDEALAKKVVDIINDLAKDPNVTIIYTTHNIDELERLDVKQLIDIHKTPEGSSEMTVFKNITKKQKKAYIAAVHSREPKPPQKKQPTILELRKESQLGDYEEKPHENIYLKQLMESLSHGRAVDVYKAIKAIKANKELTWRQAIRTRRLKEKFAKNVEASFIPPAVHRIARKKTHRKKVATKA